MKQTQFTKVDPNIFRFCARWVCFTLLSLTFARTLVLPIHVSALEDTSEKKPLLAQLRETYFLALDAEEAVAAGLLLVKNAPESERDALPKGTFHAYWGSFLCLEGRDSVWPLRKWNRTQEGLQHLDKAVRQNRQSLENRILRAAVTFHLPGFFSRGEQSQKDLAWIKAQLASPAFQKLPPNLQAFVKGFLEKTAN